MNLCTAARRQCYSVLSHVWMDTFFYVKKLFSHSVQYPAPPALLCSTH